MTTPQIWPFRPLAEVVEALEWRTDIIRSKSGEQRIALRDAPRRQLNYRHILNHQDYAAARAMLWATDFTVPDWTRVVSIGAVSSGTAVTVTGNMAGTGLLDGDAAILWQSPQDAERVIVSSVTGTTAVLDTVQRAKAFARLMPAHPAHLMQGIGVQRAAGPLVQLSIAFDLADRQTTPASSYTTYRGHDLMTDAPVVGNGSFDEGIVWPLDVVDAEIGAVAPLRERTVPDVTMAMRWHLFARADVFTLRRWLDSRRGRQAAFWMSSRARDFGLAGPISAASGSILVFAPALTTLPETAFDIEIRTESGSSYVRRVTGVSSAGTVGSRPALSLALDAPVGVDLALDQVDRVSRLQCVRFNSDRIELLHRAAAGVAVSVPCIEVSP